MATNEEIMQSIGNLQGTMASTKESLDGIRRFMATQVEQHTQTYARLGIIESTMKNTQDDLHGYKEDCTTDRKAMTTRMEKIENQDAWSGGKAAGIAATVSIVIGAISAFAAWAKH